MRGFDLVAFDMDGVLVDYRSCWTWIHDHFSVDNEDALNEFIDGRIDDNRSLGKPVRSLGEGRPKPSPLNEGEATAPSGIGEKWINANPILKSR